MLGGSKRSALEDLSNTIYVSSITVAELMIKASLGKIRIDFNPVEMATETGFALVDFSADAALLLREMPFHHKDPFDRMLISQSIVIVCVSPCEVVANPLLSVAIGLAFPFRG